MVDDFSGLSLSRATNFVRLTESRGSSLDTKDFILFDSASGDTNGEDLFVCKDCECGGKK